MKSSGQLRSHSANKSLGDSPNTKSRTQRNALKILEREEQIAKRSRIETLLVHQYITKYGTKVPQSAINSFIKAKIHSYVSSIDDIAKIDSSLGPLEQEIRDHTNRLRLEMKESKVSNHDISQYQQDLQATNGRVNSGGNRLANSGLQTLRELKNSTDPSNQLTLLNAILSVDEEEKKRQEKQTVVAKQMKFRNDLEEQMYAHQKAQNANQTAKQTQLQFVQAEQSQYEQEQERLRYEKLEKQRQERELRGSQVEERKAQRERERLLRIAEEKAEMARAKRMAELEEEKKQKLKEQQKERQEALLLENERNKQLKQQELQAKYAYEKKLNEDYERKLEDEERARQNAFGERMKQLQSFAAKYENGVGQKIQQQKTHEENRVNEELQKKYENDEQEQLRRQEQRRKQILEATKFNEQLIAHKQQQKAQERAKDIEMRKQIEKQFREGQREEQMKNEKIHQQHVDLRSNLTKQMEDAKKNKLQDKLSFANPQNQVLLKKLEEDPELMTKVMSRIHQTGEVTNRNKINQLF